MNILQASHRIVRSTSDGLDAIEDSARTCYLSEPRDNEELRQEHNEFVHNHKMCVPFEKFVQLKFIDKLRKMGHQTPFEFMDIEIEFICDRGVSHEAVRHRMCSPMQESTRYCDYNKDGKHGINVIRPIFLNSKETSQPIRWHDNYNDLNINKFDVWIEAMRVAEWAYNAFLELGASPQEARCVLPNSLKTKLRMKANVREWWHIFNLRAVNSGAHPQIREIMIPALRECAETWPALFNWLFQLLKSEDPMDGQAKPKDGN